MFDQIIQFLNSIASSEHVALVISLGVSVALGCGWWRRENDHFSRYKELETEIVALAKETSGALQNVSAAIAGMERTLDSVERLVHTVLGSRLQKEEGPGNEK